MNKYIMGIFGYQCSFPENINNLKESTEPQQEKTQTDLFLSQQNPIMEDIAEKTNLRRKKNPFVKNKILDKLKKHFIFFLFFFGLIGLIYYNQRKSFSKDTTEDFFHDKEIPCFNQIPLVEEDFFEDYEETKDKKIFICFDEGTRLFYLVEEKEINGSKTYEKYKENNILFSTFFKLEKMEDLTMSYFFPTIPRTRIPRTITIEGKIFLSIDYKKIMDILKDRVLFFFDDAFFFAGKSLQKTSYNDFDKKKNKDNYLKNLRMSKEQLFKILSFFSFKMCSKLCEKASAVFPNDDDLTKAIIDIAEVFPKKEELNLISIKYVFFDFKDGKPDITYLFLYKKIEHVISSFLGVFFNNFYKLMQKKKIKTKITISEKEKITAEEHPVWKISEKTINFLKKETKNLIFLSDHGCNNIFGYKPIEQIIKPDELEEKKKKLIEAQDKKITEYFTKHHVPEIMKIEALTKIMKKCLLSIDVLKD